MFKILTCLVRRAYSDKLPTVETWSEQHAPKTTPDQLIAAKIVDAFARDFNAWEVYDENHIVAALDIRGSVGSSSLNQMQSRFLETKEKRSNGTFQKRIVVEFLFSKESYCSDFNYSIYSVRYRYTLIGCNVNGVEINLSSGSHILHQYKKLSNQIAAAKAAAEKALADQKKLEAKFNLAEDLLGLVRNEYGALVPKELTYKESV